MKTSTITTLLLTAILSFPSSATPQPSDDEYGHFPEDRNSFRITKTIVPSRHDFTTTRDAWESQVPPLNNTFRDLLLVGDTAGALAALRALLPLSSFVIPPRNFGLLLSVLNQTGRRALQYEVGNPLTATRVNQHVLDGALYAPWRVLLLEDDGGGARGRGKPRVKFEFDSPTSVWGQFRNREVDKVARELEAALRGAAVKAAGWQSDWSWA